MAKAAVPLYAFNVGEVSKNTLARADVAKMRLAAQCQVNWMPWVVGPMMLRPGLMHVGETLNDSACRLLPFVFSKTDTALVGLTNGQMRVWINEALLTRVAVGTVVSDPNFAGGGTWSTANTTSGCSATIGGGVCTLIATALGGLAQIAETLTIAAGDQGKEHGLRVVVTNGPVTIRIGSAAGLSDYLSQTSIDTGTHSLAFTPTAASAFLQIESTDQRSKTLTQVTIEPAGVVQIPTTWATADLPNIRYDQSGDVIYVACYGQAPRMIQRRGVRPGARGWSFVLYRSADGPFHQGADAAISLTPALCYGNTTTTSNGPFFTSSHVGALLRLFTPAQLNETILGAANQYTPPAKVTGVRGDRSFSITVSGTWVGTWSLERSLIGPDEGFVQIIGTDTGWSGGAPTFTANVAAKGFNDDASNSSANAYDNVSAWYRVGFLPGNYTSGSATVSMGYPGGGRYGIARITAVSSPTSISVETLEPFSNSGAGAATTLWQISDWCPAYGYPTSVCFHEGRLWWFSGGTIPIAGSVSNDYISYAEADEFGNSIGDSAAILEDFGSGPSDTVNWGLPLTRLLLGREESIASARSSNFDQAMTPTAFVVRDCSDQGASHLPGVKVGKRGIFVQQNGRKVYELAFNPSEFDYQDRDLTRLNLDIGIPGFVGIDHAVQPDRTVHLPRGDGMSAALLYDIDDQVEAWWRIMTLGVIEGVCRLPGDGRGTSGEALEDLVYFVVNRTINGTTRRFIERLARRDQCVGGSLNYQLDCALVYSGSAVSSLQASWLPSTTISVWADGAFIGTATTDGSGNFSMPGGGSHSNVVAGLGGAVVIGSTSNPMANGQVPAQTFSSPQNALAVGTQYNGYPCEVFADIGGTGRGLQHIGALTVSGGAIALPNNQVASTIVAYLGFVAPFMSAKLAYGAQMGSALTMKKKLDHVGLVLYDTAAAGLSVGQRMDALDPLPLVEADQVTPAGTVWSEYDGPMVELPGEWNTDARLCLLAQAPNPCMVGAAVLSLQTSDSTPAAERAPRFIGTG